MRNRDAAKLTAAAMANAAADMDVDGAAVGEIDVTEVSLGEFVGDDEYSTFY